MRRQKSLESLWDRLQNRFTSASVKKPSSPAHVRFCIKPHLVPTDESSPPKSRCATQRLRSFELKEDAPSYGIPADKYSAVLLCDRQYQAHILDSEFRLLAEKTKTCAQLLQDQPKVLLSLLGAEEQRSFNVKIEKTLAWLDEVVQLVTHHSSRLRRAGRQRPLLPAAAHVSSEPDAYEDNVKLLLASSTTFSSLFSEYTRLARSDQHKTLTFEQCLVVLKRVSQIRLSLNYLVEATAAHEEAIRFNRRMLKSVSGFSSLGGAMREKLKVFEDAHIDVKATQHRPTLSTKEFALRLIEQKHSARSPSPQRAETVRPERKCDTERYSNVSNLFLETKVKKGMRLRRPTSKFRKLRKSRAETVLERALYSSNPLVANSVRQLLASHPTSSMLG